MAERVAYQRALEEVFWRHRIWPMENPSSKPPLAAVMSQAQLEEKVAAYCRASQDVEEMRGWPIAASELQAEMERMARDTKQPDVLRELFAALENDPFVVAECLARPILAERLRGEPSIILTSWRTRRARADYRLPGISVPSACADNTWTATTLSNAPDERFGHVVVWTGSEMIVWGGGNFSSSGGLSTGGRYTPSTDSWTATSTANVPPGQGGHSGVWTGSEMIVWGGNLTADIQTNTGGKYDPISDVWVATSTTDAPLARSFHSAVWTGSEMIVWGGVRCGGNCWVNTGGRYDPRRDSWTATSLASAPSARWSHTALWTGREMIVWGGTNQMNYLNTGGRYNPATDSWVTTSLVNVGPGRFAHSAVWTGGEMIVWAGVEDGTFMVTKTGARYDPATDGWGAISTTGAPAARVAHSGVWTGREMLVWGGNDTEEDFGDGARYNPAGNTWTPMMLTTAPIARNRHTAIWTGNEMIVWGGISSALMDFLKSGARYCAQPSTPLVLGAVSRKTHGNAGQFEVNLLLSGTPGVECRSGGATGDYTVEITFAASVSVSGTPQASVTAGTGTVGSDGASNGGKVITTNAVVTIPLTNVANAQTLQVTLNNVNGSTNVTVPMRVLVGDVNGSGAVNATDIAFIKARSGQPVDAANFSADLTADGAINATDVGLAKSLAGTTLP